MFCQEFDQIFCIIGETQIVGMQITVLKVEGHMGHQGIAVNVNKTMSLTLIDQPLPALV